MGMHVLQNVVNQKTMKPKNVKQFRELLKRYESITLEEIKYAAKITPSSCYPWNDATLGERVANRLTGFGSRSTCILCTAVSECSECVYSQDRRTPDIHCLIDKNRPTAIKIYNADTEEELLKAYRSRARYMRKNYSQYLKPKS